METRIINSNDTHVGVEVLDQNGFEHRISVEKPTGEIDIHEINEYPHAREDRTQEEQRIMSQVEARAKYEAQRSFEEADILKPMWDPAHIEAGLEALSQHPLEQFHDQFRDFCRAMEAPGEFIDAAFDLETVRIFKVYRFRGTDIVDVAPVFLRYLDDGDTIDVGTFPDYPEDEQIVCCTPPMEFPDDFSYEAEFQDMVVIHLLSQIRDLYLHMGETPPDEYQVEGFGKFDIHGDGIGDS